MVVYILGNVRYVLGNVTRCVSMCGEESCRAGGQTRPLPQNRSEYPCDGLRDLNVLQWARVVRGRRQS